MVVQNRNILIISDNISKIVSYKRQIKKTIYDYNIDSFILNHNINDNIISNWKGYDLFIIDIIFETYHCIELCSQIFSQDRDAIFLIISERLINDTPCTIEEDCIFDYSTSPISDSDFLHKVIFLLNISRINKKKKLS